MTDLLKDREARDLNLVIHPNHVERVQEVYPDAHLKDNEVITGVPYWNGFTLRVSAPMEIVPNHVRIELIE